MHSNNCRNNFLDGEVELRQVGDELSAEQYLIAAKVI